MNEIKIVSSHYNEDVSWIEKCGLDYLVVSKSENDPPIENFEKIKNVGPDEFRSYIYYILNYWDELPEYVGFIHGHENAYHQQFSMSEIFEKLKKIKLESFYLNLNGDVENPLNSHITSFHCFKEKHLVIPEFKEIWYYLGLHTFMEPPEFVCGPSSTQCVVKSERIKLFPKSFWQHLYDTLSNNYDYKLALTLEIAWPIMFGTHPEKNIYFIKEFYDFFIKKELTTLVICPKSIFPAPLNDNTIDISNVCRAECSKSFDSKQQWANFMMKFLIENF